jgi:uncharacterized protein (TIGR02147 family)
MVEIFDFEDDFRKYLKQVIKDKKLSYRAIGLETELDHRMIYDMVNKSKHLSLANALKLSTVFKHTTIEKEYFIQLVHLTQSKNEEEREYYRDQLLKIKSETGDSTPATVDKQEYYSTWRHSAVRSLIGMHQFRDDYQWLGNALSLPISSEEARQSVQLLERLGLIRKDINGIYYLIDQNVWADLSNEGKKRFHRDCADVVKKQIFYTYPDDCQVLNSTLGMSKETYKIVCDETKKLLNKTLKLIKSDKKADRVYQYQLALVPLSRDEHSE